MQAETNQATLDDLTLEHSLFQRPLHSNELRTASLSFGVTESGVVERIESLLGVRGYMAHIVGLGWTTYQWRHVPECSQEQFPNLVSFIEIFSTYYGGMYRSSSKDGLQGAANKLIAQVQKMLSCPEHEFEPYDGYENGLMACKHCGFHGYSSQVEILQSQLDSAQSQAQVYRSEYYALIGRLQEWGIKKGAFTEELLLDIEVFNAMQNRYQDIAKAQGEHPVCNP